MDEKTVSRPRFLDFVIFDGSAAAPHRAPHYNLDERRQFEQTIVDAKAMLLVEPGPVLISCEVINLTDNGAHLVTDVVGNVALFVEGEIVNFSLDHYRTIRRARVAWAAAPELGIEFDET